MNRNYIKELVIGVFEKVKSIRIEIPYPKTPEDHYCLTALCGKNNTGKTHILRGISTATSKDYKFHNKNEKESLNVHAVLVNPNQEMPNILHLDDLTFAKTRFELIPVGSFKHDPAGHRPKYRELIHKYICSQIKVVFKDKFNESLWFGSYEYRLSFVKENIEEDRIYLCEYRDEVNINFEEAVGGKLYFCHIRSKDNHFLQLVIRYDEYRIFRYQNWSEGQKALFAGLLTIQYCHPDILLIDEIENHFHPEYITHLAILIKKVVPQTILVTHHPHVLFSKLVDKLYYIELNKNDIDDPPKSQILPKAFRARSPKKIINELISDFDIITAAYGLFHNHDRQLLNLAQATCSSIDNSLTSILVDVLNDHIADAKKTLFLDTQTEQLQKILKSYFEIAKTDKFKVLDYGAGRGRTLFELMKSNSPILPGCVEWYFWEREPSVRQALKSCIKQIKGPRTFIVNAVEELDRDFFDIAILSNVLHEVTPVAFGLILSNIRKALKVKTGSLVILELFPLIRPEKYAVPYRLSDLELILNKIGWKFECGFLPVKSGAVQAYWILAHSPDSTKSSDEESIRKIVEKKWEEILTVNCVLYDGKKQIRSASDQIQLMGNLTTIASIMNYKKNNWI